MTNEYNNEIIRLINLPFQ